MDYDDKLDLCADLMGDDFHIPSRTAYSIIINLELEDIVLERYAEEIEEAEREQEAKWEKEIEMNPDLYKNDIHGGV